MHLVELIARWASPALLGLAIALGMAGCATGPKVAGRTSVVLLPDDDGKVGALSLSAGGSSEEIRQAWQGSIVQRPDSKPSPVQVVDAAALNARHGTLLKAQPPAVKTFVVYFLISKAVLTEESQALLPTVLAAIRERKPTEVTVFGHADPSGSRDGNMRLSAERAQVVADWLRAADPTLDRISVQYFGDSRPHGVAGDVDGSTDPARFRRAEIQIL